MSKRTEVGTSVNVQLIIIHPSYDTVTLSNDVAVIKLVSPITLSSTAQIIRLATNEPQAGTSLIATGWGKLYEGGPRSFDLRAVVVYLVTRSECKTLFRNSLGVIDNATICAGAPGKDVCSGDSGGPLVHRGIQVGIVSWGLGCAVPGLPGVYANVFNLRPFIENVMKL